MTQPSPVTLVEIMRSFYKQIKERGVQIELAPEPVLEFHEALAQTAHVYGRIAALNGYSEMTEEDKEVIANSVNLTWEELSEKHKDMVVYWFQLGHSRELAEKEPHD